MRLVIDTGARTATLEPDSGQARTIDLYSREAFEWISRQWVRVGWNQKYVYTFSWLGRPLIQLPEDVLRIQEAIYQVRPDVIVESGVAHGGSLVLYASILSAMGRGRVIGVDIEIRPHNRRALEEHVLAPLITLVEGNSVAPHIVEQVRGLIAPGETVMVLLDSNHSRAHVEAELEAYAGLVTPGSYIVATDGVTQDLFDVPRGRREWRLDNPVEAIKAFLQRHDEFAAEEPRWPFNESELSAPITHWPSAYLRRR